LKKERNCGMPPYPIYQGRPGMMPGMTPGMMPGMAPGGMQYGAPGYQGSVGDNQVGPTNISQEISNINRRIDALERRVRVLEKDVSSSPTPTPYNNTFNDSNYKMI